MELKDVAYFTPDGYFRMLAGKVRAGDPRVIEAGLKTIAHWRSIGQTNPHRLDQWEKLLREAQAHLPGANDRLLQMLEGTDPGSVRLRDFHPFTGILTREERRIARGTCV